MTLSHTALALDTQPTNIFIWEIINPYLFKLQFVVFGRWQLNMFLICSKNSRELCKSALEPCIKSIPGVKTTLTPSRGEFISSRLGAFSPQSYSIFCVHFLLKGQYTISFKQTCTIFEIKEICFDQIRGATALCNKRSKTRKRILDQPNFVLNRNSYLSSLYTS